MAPDSLDVQLVTIAATVITAVVTAFTWDRLRRWWGWLVKAVAVTLCLLTALSSAAVALNRELEIYGSWPEVLGHMPRNTGDAALDIGGQPSPTTGSRVVAFTVAGTASGVTLPAFAYLPAGYDGAALRHERLPVIEALDGFPGSPGVWLKRLGAPAILDQEIASGRMAPTVVIFPYQTTSPTHDTECVDAVGGLRMDTFLTTDVPAAVETMFRVRRDGAGWGLIGYSAGAFCAVNLALRHPTRYAATASLSGYFTASTDATTGDLYRGSIAIRDQNSPLWRIKTLPIPPLAMFLSCARDDTSAYASIVQFLASARAPLRVTTAITAHGGHSSGAWRRLEAPAFDWLSSWLADPVASST